MSGDAEFTSLTVICKAPRSGYREEASRPLPDTTANTMHATDTVRAIAVLDRTKEPGAIGEPLYQDVVTALAENGPLILRQAQDER